MVLSKDNVTEGTMPTEDRMTIDERRKYLRIQHPHYRKANRQERTRLLNEMEGITGLDRKTLIRLMALKRSDLTRKPRRKQRGRTYDHEVDDALRVILDSFGYLCAERLAPNLVWMATHLASHGEMTVSDELLEKLAQISISSVQRLLNRIGQDMPRLPRKAPRSSNLANRDVPMKRIPWNETEPGHFETDLVHHSGPSASGEYIHTLQMIDVATGWSERVALLGRSYVAMCGAFRIVLSRIPFPVREIHPDNGIEFFNSHLRRFWGEAAAHIQLSRSHPYQKNDNRFVEQKNKTLVRHYLGYDRFDSVAQVRAINKLYEKLWVYDNFFQPVMRLKEKDYLPGTEGVSRVRRCFDRAKTPFERLCDTQAVPQSVLEQLRRLRDETNPRQLRHEIDDLLTYIFTLPCTDPATLADVYETLPTDILSWKGDGIPVTLSIDRIDMPR
jgi:hypothetical protein